MSNARKVFAVAGLAALARAVAPVAEAQPPIRVGASLSQTGVGAAVGQVCASATSVAPACGAGG